VTQTPHDAPPEPAGGAAPEPVVPGALLDDDVLEDLRLAEMAERERLERRIARNDVTAVLVSHNGARWVPYVLTALADLTTRRTAWWRWTPDPPTRPAGSCPTP
jgi:hypothetical protein